MEERIRPKDAGETICIGAMRLRSRRLCRTVRVGGIPVLTVTAVWPEADVPTDPLCLCDPGEVSRLDPAPLPEDMTRFHEGCRRVAEAFVDWGMGEPTDQARAAYEAAGPGAAYRFPRRELSCRLIAHTLPFDGMPDTLTEMSRRRDGNRLFCLEREVYMGWRRREGGTVDSTYSLWMYPALCPIQGSRRRHV